MLNNAHNPMHIQREATTNTRTTMLEKPQSCMVQHHGHK
jgi:hypothetical protein